MFRILSLSAYALVLALPAAAMAGDDRSQQSQAAQTSSSQSTRDADIRAYIDAITEAADRNPHSCADDGPFGPEKPDLASRPQS